MSTPLTTADLVQQLEQAMVQAAQPHHAGRTLVTVDVHLSCMRPAHGPLVASAQVVGGGKTLRFCEAQLHDSAGAVVAQALGTLRAV